MGNGVRDDVLLVLDDPLLFANAFGRRREFETTRYMRLSGGGRRWRGVWEIGRVKHVETDVVGVNKERAGGDLEKLGNLIHVFKPEAAPAAEDVPNPAIRLADEAREIGPRPALVEAHGDIAAEGVEGAAGQGVEFHGHNVYKE